MVAVGVSYLLLRRTTLYASQVSGPAASPARAVGLAWDALGTLRVRDLGALRPAADPIPGREPIQTALEAAAGSRHSVFPVCDAGGRVTGVVTLRTLRSLLDGRAILPALIVEDVASPRAAVGLDDTLRRVTGALEEANSDELLVLDGRGAVLGVVGHEDIARIGLREAARTGRTPDGPAA